VQIRDGRVTELRLCLIATEIFVRAEIVDKVDLQGSPLKPLVRVPSGKAIVPKFMVRS
jgi:hypothetical protein